MAGLGLLFGLSSAAEKIGENLAKDIEQRRQMDLFGEKQRQQIDLFKQEQDILQQNRLDLLKQKQQYQQDLLQRKIDLQTQQQAQQAQDILNWVVGDYNRMVEQYPDIKKFIPKDLANNWQNVRNPEIAKQIAEKWQTIKHAYIRASQDPNLLEYLKQKGFDLNSAINFPSIVKQAIDEYDKIQIARQIYPQRFQQQTTQQKVPTSVINSYLSQINKIENDYKNGLIDEKEYNDKINTINNFYRKFYPELFEETQQNTTKSKEIQNNTQMSIEDRIKQNYADWAGRFLFGGIK